jgi:uncharacterized protein YjbI with pentapeptide repeats
MFYQIKNRWTDAVLFEGDFDTMRLCVHAARNSGADLRDANLRGAALSGAALRGANLRGADLSGANLRGSDLSYADLSGANLRGSDLSYADLSGAALSYADLRGAALSYADLSGANLRGADLSGANLRGSDLSYADLSGAKIREGVTLNRAPLRRATRADGYEFFLLDTSAGWRVMAGCRFFTFEEAWSHWTETRGGTDLGDESLDILTMFSLALDREEGKQK